MSWGPLSLRTASHGIVFEGEASPAPGGGSKPDGAVWVFTFASASAADDAKGSDGDLAILIDTTAIIQKESGTWATS